MDINIYIDEDYRNNYLMSLPRGIFNYKESDYAVKLVEEVKWKD